MEPKTKTESQQATDSPSAGGKARVDWSALANAMTVGDQLTTEDLYQAKEVLDSLFHRLQRAKAPGDMISAVNGVAKMLEDAVGELDQEEDDREA